MVCKILYSTQGCYTGEMFANPSKIIRNWFLTLDINNLVFSTLFAIYKSGQKKGDGCNMSAWQYICLCTNLCTYLFMLERKKKKERKSLKEKKASLKFPH